MNITINTQGPCSVIIDTRSGNIQVQGEYNVVVEAEPITVTEQGFPEQQAEEVQRIINPVAQKDPVENYDSGPVFDLLREDLIEQEDESPEEVDDQEGECEPDDHPEINALQTQSYPKKRGRPAKHIGEQTYNGKTIINRYRMWKNAGSPTPVVDFTRKHRIPYQSFMDKKREIEKN